MQETKKRRSPNTLEMNEVIKLSNWLTSVKSQKDWPKMNREQLALKATTELNFIVNTRNLASVAEAANIILPRLMMPKAEVNSTKNGTRAKLVRLRRAIVELYQEFGKPVPDYLEWDDEGNFKIEG